MPTYLLEIYLPRSTPITEAADAARVIAANRTELRYVRTWVVAEDETCFHVFEAPSREVVTEAAREAGLADARVTEARSTPT